MSLGNGSFHPASVHFWDKSLETSAMKVYGLPVTAANLDAQSTLWAAVVSASVALVYGLLFKQLWVNETVVNASPAQADVNQLAKRETKLLVQYIDNTSQKRLIATLPTLNDSLVTYLPQAKDFVAITAGQGAGTEVTDFVSAFEGYVLNPQTANAVTVVGLKVVGRNN